MAGFSPKNRKLKGVGPRKLAAERIAALDTMGDAAVFQLYGDIGTVRKMVDSLGDYFDCWKPRNPGERVGVTCFYEWLDADESGERKRLYQRAKEWRAHDAVERAELIAEAVDADSYQADRVKIDTALRVAGLYNRSAYGKQDQSVKVTHDLGESFLAAMRSLDGSRTVEGGDSRPTIQSSTQANTEILEGEYTVKGDTE